MGTNIRRQASYNGSTDIKSYPIKYGFLKVQAGAERTVVSRTLAGLQKLLRRYSKPARLVVSYFRGRGRYLDTKVKYEHASRVEPEAERSII